MPDLVYNVKFQIDDTSLQKVSQTTTSVTGGTSGNAQKDAERTKKSIRQIINEYSLLGKEADNVTRKLKSSSAGFTQFNSSTDATSQKLEGLRSELVPAIASLEAIANSTESTTQEQLKARTAISQLIGVYDRAGNASQTYAANQRILAETMETVGNETRRMNASFSTSNQVLFSFSDGIQDASQFSYGFASGMRAIGNNIGFTGELFANLNRRVQEYNQTHGPNATSVTQELRNSLRGPAGILLALNLAITAFTVVSREIEKYKKRTEEAEKSSYDFAKSVDAITGALQSFGVFEGDVFGVERTSVALEIVNNQLSKARESFFDEEDQSALNNAIREQSSLLQFISVNGERVKNQRYEELEAEIAILQAKKNSSMTQEQIDALTQKQTELQVELGVQIGVANNERVKAAKTEKEAAEAKEAADKKAIEDLNERRTTESNLADFKELSDSKEAERKAALHESRMAQLEDEAALMELILNPPKAERDETNETQAIRRALEAQKILEEARMEVAGRGESRIEAVKLQIQEEFQNKRLALVRAGLASEENLNLLREQAEKRLGKARMQINAETVSSIAQSVSVLGNVFGASKDIQIAMAIIDSGAAIVKTFAQLGFPAGIPAALAVAARTAQTIKQMKDTNIGDKNPVSGGSFASASTLRAPSGFQVSGEGPSYTPTMYGPRSFRQEAQISVNVDETGFGLYLKGIDGNLQNDTMFVKSA
jgi:hypothetical protein